MSCHTRADKLELLVGTTGRSVTIIGQGRGRSIVHAKLDWIAE